MANIGLARFSKMGPMEYLLDCGNWLLDTQLYSGAPVLLFESKGAALVYAAEFPNKERPGWVEFHVDGEGTIVAL